MKRNHFSALAAMVFAASLGLAATQQLPPPPTQPPPPGQPTPLPPIAQTTSQEKVNEVTLTGCLVQGSGPTVFIFDNAKSSDEPKAAKGKTFLLVVGAEDLSFMKHVSHQVTIAGSAETKAAPDAPAGKPVPEKDLPKFTAKSLTMVSANCMS